MTAVEEMQFPTVDTTEPPEAKPARRKTNAGALAVRVCAELLGTFLICFVIYVVSTIGCSIYGIDLTFIAVVTGLTYAAATVALGGVCGAQFNPAVTIAAMLTSKTGLLEGVLNIIAQVVGAIGAGALTVSLLPTSDSTDLSVWLTTAVNGFDSGSVSYSTLSYYGLSSFGITFAILVEIVACVMIVAGAMRTPGEHGESSFGHAVAVGLTYGIGAAICYPITGAALNPARATGIAIFAQGQGLTVEPLSQLWVFWVCPVLAAALVALPMVIAQMVAERPTAKPAVAETEAGDAAEQAESGYADDGEAAGYVGGAEGMSGDDAAVGDDQADAQGDADKGVESH